MNFKVAIYHQILEPKYMRMYYYLEEMDRRKFISSTARKAHLQDVVEVLVDIIAIKEKYGIDYTDDLELLEKYKK